MLWVATHDEEGHLYYFNRATEEVQWQEPREYVHMQDQLEDMARIHQTHAVQTCARIGLDLLLRSALVRWHRTALPRSTRFYRPASVVRDTGHVKAMVPAVDATIRARHAVLRLTAEALHLREQLAETTRRADAAELEVGRCVAELAECKLQLAESEFTRLRTATPLPAKKAGPRTPFRTK